MEERSKKSGSPVVGSCQVIRFFLNRIQAQFRLSFFIPVVQYFFLHVMQHFNQYKNGDIA